MHGGEGLGSAVRVAAVAAVAGLVLWVGVAGAEAVPSVTFSCTPAPQDCSGWHRSNVSIAWTVLPSSASRTGCENKTYTTDTAGTIDYCRASDGSSSVTVEVTIRVDKTPPTVTGASPSRGADVNAWYNQPVAVSFSGSDRTSGIAACTNTTYGGPDSASASVPGTCTDNAGNVPGRLRAQVRRNRPRRNGRDARAPAERGRLVQSTGPLQHPGQRRDLGR
jgi:hypothetical protein